MSGSRMHAQRGVSLIEVLIAMVILAVGLLGLVGLQGRLQVLQIESYQRAQALMLLQDMSNRISLNRNNAASYVTASPLGEGMTCPTTNSNRVEADVRDWCNALQGAGETMGGSNVGAMVGGRGCVEGQRPSPAAASRTHLEPRRRGWQQRHAQPRGDPAQLRGRRRPRNAGTIPQRSPAGSQGR